MLWFIKGDTNIQYLLKYNNNIWNEWAFENYVNSEDYQGPDMTNFGHRSQEDPEFNELAKRALDRLDEIGIHLVDVGELEDLFNPTSHPKKGGYKLVQALTDEVYAHDATQRLIHRVIANALDTASRTS